MNEHPEGIIPGSGRAGEPKTLGSSLRICGWQCAHMTITAGATLARPLLGCGCEMQPYYDQPGAVTAT